MQNTFFKGDPFLGDVTFGKQVYQRTVKVGKGQGQSQQVGEPFDENRVVVDHLLKQVQRCQQKKQDEEMAALIITLCF